MCVEKFLWATLQWAWDSKRKKQKAARTFCVSACAGHWGNTDQSEKVSVLGQLTVRRLEHSYVLLVLCTQVCRIKKVTAWWRTGKWWHAFPLTFLKKRHRDLLLMASIYWAPTWASHCVGCTHSTGSSDAIGNPILPIRKLWLSKLEELARNQTATKWQRSKRNLYRHLSENSSLVANFWLSRLNHIYCWDSIFWYPPKWALSWAPKTNLITGCNQSL